MKVVGLVIILILFAIVVTLLSLVVSQVKEAKNFKKTTIIYLFLTGLCAGFSSLFGFIGIKENLIAIFILMQAWMLFIGILHVYLIYRLVPWTAKKKFVWEFFFTVSVAVLGAVFFLLVFAFLLKEQDLQYILLAAFPWFFVPFFFSQAFYRYLAIPSRLFRKWYYPVRKDIPDPLDSELVSLLVVSFVFHKKMNDPEITTFRAKAPAHMVFGRLFYYFLNDYNERHREGPIEYIDPDDHPHGWVFHHKANWLGMKRYIDPDQIITDNYIKENSVIICQRVKD